MKVIDKGLFFQQIKYKPHPKQRLFHDSAARFRIACCGRRFGKSTMAGRDEEPKLFLPNRRVWIVGPTYDLAEKEFRVIWNDIIVGQKMGRDKRIRRAYNKRVGDMYIEMPWGTRVECRSAQHPENLVGEALDGVIMSEAAKHTEETWKRYIRPSLADHRGSATFPTTPEGLNWIYDMFQLGANPDYPEYESWRFPSWENPVVYPGGREDPEIKEQERSTDKAWFNQEVGADFSSFVGKIYEEWDATVHVKRVPFQPQLPSYIAFDWGFTNPLAAVEFQIGPDDSVYIWREHYKAFTTLPEHVEMLKRREQPDLYHLDLAFGDAADPDAAAYITNNLVACYAMPEAKVNWRQGIDRVKMHLACYPTGNVIDEFGTPEDAPHLFVDFSCENVIREFNNYRSKDAAKNSQNVPEMPSNKSTWHTLDAIRYALVHIYDLGVTYHLTDMADIYAGGQMSGFTPDQNKSGLLVPSAASSSFGPLQREQVTTSSGLIVASADALGSFAFDGEDEGGIFTMEMSF